MAAKQSVLLVDNDTHITRFLKSNLANNNFKVREARTGAAALAFLAEREFAIMILEIRLPDQDGLALVGEIRKSSTLPVIILSVCNDENVKVQAFELGVDDYVTKPFGMAELLARIKAAIRRRVQSTGIQPLVRVGNLEIDLINYYVRRGGAEIPLTKTELALLRLFVEHQNKVLTHEVILRSIRGKYKPQDSQYLRVYIQALRGKIEDVNSKMKMIHTISGIGYRFGIAPAAETAVRPGNARQTK